MKIHNVKVSSKVYSFKYTRELIDKEGERADGRYHVDSRLIEIDEGMPALDTLEACLHEITEAGVSHAGKHENGISCDDINSIVQTLAATMVESPKCWDDLRELANMAREEEAKRDA